MWNQKFPEPRCKVMVFPARADIASLPANATAVMVYDLGEDWAQYAWVGITIYAAGVSTGAVSLSGSDDGATSMGLLPMSNGTEFFISAVSANASAARLARPRGRYLRLIVVGNASVPLGSASRVFCAAYPS